MVYTVSFSTEPLRNMTQNPTKSQQENAEIISNTLYLFECTLLTWNIPPNSTEFVQTCQNLHTGNLCAKNGAAILIYATDVLRHKWAMQYRLIMITAAPLCTYFILVTRRTRDLQKLTYYYAIYFIYLYILYTFLLTYSMEQSPSWEANWFCS
jgi:hypothetical protein